MRSESKTLATITFQNYFRLYNKLSGMTGTALTEEAEFREIYKLDVIEIPTNKPVSANRPRRRGVQKRDRASSLPSSTRSSSATKQRQPVLVGTVTIDKSELLSKMLKKRGIKHEVLNAKYHEKEAEIVAQAGKKGAVTIATNMAGRGTDIMLGGNAEYLAKNEMRKMGFDEEMIVEATGYGETDDEKILNARKTFQELEAKHKDADQSRGGRRSAPPAACSSWAPSATSPAVSTTSSAAVPAVRATPVKAGSSSRWRTTSCASSAANGFRP